MDGAPKLGGLQLLGVDFDGVAISADQLRRGDQLHVDGNEWVVGRIAVEGDEVALTIARRSCGMPGTSHFRLRREQPFSVVTRHGEPHVYRYEMH